MENEYTLPKLPTIPHRLDVAAEAHKKWQRIVKDAKLVIEADADIQRAASKGMRLKGRALPPQVVGRTYAEYCNLVNRMYEAFLNSVQLQRAVYMKHVISVFVKRMYELRGELVNLILTDYVYVDDSLVQLQLTPQDIEVVVPCHFPVEARPESAEELLQAMWTEAWERKHPPTPTPEHSLDWFLAFQSSIVAVKIKESVTELSEDYLNILVIQTAERGRQWYMVEYKKQCVYRQTYSEAAKDIQPVPEDMKHRAATFVQKVFRQFMLVKRKRVVDHVGNLFIGIVSDPWRQRLDKDEEIRKLYNKRREVNIKSKQLYEKHVDYIKKQIYLLKEDDEIQDITDEVREWFREWYLGYGFFPEFPYEIEGGTILVVRGDFPTIEEKMEEDEREMNTRTVKLTKAQLKKEKKQAAIDAKKAEKAEKKKEYQRELKEKKNPLMDKGYKVKQSTTMPRLTEVLQAYLASWSIYDNFPAEGNGEVVYGYIEELLVEEVMSQFHRDCRVLVDELLRLELKTLIAAQRADYKEAGLTFPKTTPRKRPKEIRQPTPIQTSETIKEDAAEIFDLEIVSKPTAKISDIIGDSNYGAYEANIADPNSTFPPPCYGDIRNRLKLSCVLGAGIQPGAVRNKAVLLLGQPRNGKSFLVDCVIGEMNAVKIDLSPEVFSGMVQKPEKLVGQAFAVARAFQPSVIFIRNVDRVFKTQLTPEERQLRVTSIQKLLLKYVKGIAAKEKIIFIATCSSIPEFNPAKMMRLFSEVILVPRPDYGSVRDFFYHKFQSISSMERDPCVQPLAQTLKGYGFGTIVEAYNSVMTADRLIKLNVKPIDPMEFLDYMIDAEEEPLTLEEFQAFQELYLKFSPLKRHRDDLVVINRSRAAIYERLAKIAAKKGGEEDEAG